MKQKVCMLLSYLPFLDGRLFECEAKSLLKNGYEVTIIAPRINGFLFDIDGKPFTKSFRDKIFYHHGVKIVTYESEQTSEKVAENPLYRLGLVENADYYHASELDAFTIGKEIKKTLKNKKLKLVYDSRQLTPDPFSLTITSHIKQKRKSILVENLKEVDYVLTVSDSIKSWYLAIDPLLPVEVIYNSPSLAPPVKVKGQGHYTEKFVIAHEGNLSKATSEKIFSATDSCSKIMDITCKIIGGTRHGDSLVVPSHIQPNVNHTGWVDYRNLPTALSDVEVGLIDLDATRSLNHVFGMPSKLFSYLNNGIPVLVNKGSDMEKFVLTHQCGIVLNRLNPAPSDYVKGILYFYRNKSKLKQMSLNARKIMEDIYSWEHMERRLLAVYNSLATGQTPYLFN